MQHPNHPPPGSGAPPFPPPPPPPSQPPLPPGWVQTIDPASGRPYFANPTTGQTSWEPPPYYPPPPPPPPNPSIPPPPSGQPHFLPQFQQQPHQHGIPQVQQTQQPPIHVTQQHAMQHVMAQPDQIPVPVGVPHPHAITPSNPPQPLPSIPSQHIHPPVQLSAQNASLPSQPPTAQTPTAIPAPSKSTATFSNLGPATAITPGLLVPSVRAMIDAEYTQKENSTLGGTTAANIPRLELDGLTAGSIADLCNVSREWRSRNVRVDKGDFADDDMDDAAKNDMGVTGSMSSGGVGSEEEKKGVDQEGMNQYYLPLQPFQLPVASRPPHIEPGRVDIRLHALYNKLGRL